MALIQTVTEVVTEGSRAQCLSIPHWVPGVGRTWSTADARLCACGLPAEPAAGDALRFGHAIWHAPSPELWLHSKPFSSTRAHPWTFRECLNSNMVACSGLRRVQVKFGAQVLRARCAAMIWEFLIWIF